MKSALTHTFGAALKATGLAALLAGSLAAGSLARMAGPMLAGPLFGLAIGGPYWFGALLTLPAIGLAVVISRSLRRAA